MLRVTNLIRNIVAQFVNIAQGAGEAAAEAVANQIAQTARDSMHPGYGTASAPGTPPNIQTGELVGSIQVEKRRGGADVVVGASYAAELEYGTSRIAARPFMTPAVERVTGQGAEEAAEVVRGMFNRE